MNKLKSLIVLIEENLIKNIVIESKYRHSVKVSNIPINWHVLGTGNYAAVLFHDDFPEYAVKVYRRTSNKYKNKSQGINDEVLVYQKLNSFKRNFFAQLHHYDYERKYIIIDRIEGITLYECLRRGIKIPDEVINQVDNAIEYLKSLNLSPHDIHFKNIITLDKTAKIIDVSDFLNFEYCPLWDHSKKFYSFYNKIHIFPIPAFLLNIGKNFYKILISINCIKNHIFRSKLTKFL